MKLAALVLCVLVIVVAPAWAGTVGFQKLALPNPGGKPLTVGIWYPSDAAARPTPLEDFTQVVAADGPVAGRRLPLVVISHGSGGSFAGHYDTALALARAGFVAASITHEGDSWDDQSKVAEIWRRPAQLHQLIDYVLAAWPGRGHVDAARVGAFGFSAGGFTVLVAAGGVPNLATVAPYCASHAQTFTCKIVAAHAAEVRTGAALPASAWVHDRRIKAIVVAAPALGFSFGRRGLGAVTIPVQLWRDEEDHVLPYPDFAEAVRAALPRPPEYHVVADADHYDFLAPCPAALARQNPDICASRPGFDRAAFHARFDAAVVDFFRRTLG
ncbi:MAG TPA: dienelactone hydrolase [Caulobacteraceae bacterium]|nr:dienelactone hydrolase [Caulobacteraceae bacterium]